MKDGVLTQQGRQQSVAAGGEASQPQGALRQISSPQLCVCEHLGKRAAGGVVVFFLVLSSCFSWRLEGRFQTY